MKTKQGRFHRMVHFLVKWLTQPSLCSFTGNTIPLWKSLWIDVISFAMPMIVMILTMMVVLFLAT